jgi:hypothetical protein
MRILSRPAAAARGLPIAVFALLLAALAPGCATAQPGGHDHAHHGTAATRPTAKPKSHHPAPRADITAGNVVRPDAVPERARDAYAVAARIPAVLDGIFCHCECHDRDGRRSLLECFHDDMASTCGICQGQARMAGELHAAGKSLDEIRNAIDRRWGG